MEAQSVNKFIIARERAEKAAKQKLDHLYKSLSKREDMQTKARETLRDIVEERKHKFERAKARREAAKSVVDKKMRDIDREGMREYKEEIREREVSPARSFRAQNSYRKVQVS